MRISKSHNKKTGVTYVYEVLENHWDKEKGYPVNKRRLIGKIDPATGEIIPTRKRASSKAVSEQPDSQPATTGENSVTAQDSPSSDASASLRSALAAERDFLSSMLSQIQNRILQIDSEIQKLS